MIKIVNIEGRDICIKGIGKMFYQDGFPISMAVSELKKKNIEVSIFHVADECLKNGWSTSTICKKFIEDFVDSGEEKIELKELEEFCNSSYEDQREKIFQYLFNTPSKELLESKEKRDIFVENNINLWLKN